MSGHSEAVTSSDLPPHYHDPNAMSTSYNSTSYRTNPSLGYGSNQRPPIAVRSCAQQQRLAEYANFNQPGLLPHEKPIDSSTYAGAYGHSSRTSYGGISTSQHHTDIMITSTHPGYILPDKSKCSVCSLPNERYRLDAPPYKEHDNEDDFLIYANQHSLCMCVFDGHDGSRAVKFVRKYMKGNIFDTKSWMTLSKFNHHEEMESALAEFIKVTEKDFFKSVRNYIDEKVYLQSQIPKVCMSLMGYYL